MQVCSRILAIDDDDALTAMLRRGLDAEGFEVETASDGSGGIELARRSRPDVVILDLMLPDMNGFDVCRALRNAAGGDELAIIILSARASPRDRVFGLEIGADDYLIKPFHFAELVARVRVQLRRRGGAARTLRLGSLTVDTDGRTAVFDDRPLLLTPKEYEMLEVLLRNPRRV